MTAKESRKKPDGRKTKAPSKRQLEVVKHRAEGKTFKDAGILAGYSPKNAAQSAYQAIQGLRGRVPDLLDKAGLSEEIAIEKYLKPALEATETIYAQKDGKFTDRRQMIAWNIRMTALRTLLELHGSYAPKVYDNQGTAPVGNINFIVDCPAPDWSKLPPHPALKAPTNGNQPQQQKAIEVSSNGQKPDPRPKD
jgi:hypothetical protein